MIVKEIENLFEKTNIIKRKYDDFAEYTGENFNIFNILKLDSKELIHSSFIANLLNAKGSHNQNDVFLKLFINEIEGLFSVGTLTKSILTNFKTLESYAKIEENIGKVDYDLAIGGRIDIVIKSETNCFVIENKIKAGDQEAQLVRYKNAYHNAPIIYLTPFGEQPSANSKGNLKEGEDFVSVSYEYHVVNWIEECIKEMANKPIIRETLNQYLNLVKQITNQTTNNKMEQELSQLIINNKIAMKTLLEAHNSLVNKVKFKVDELHNLLTNEKYNSNLNEIVNKYSIATVEISDLRLESNVKIFRLYFKSVNFNNEIFNIEIHNNENFEYTIDTGIWGFKDYKNLIENVLNSSDYSVVRKYGLNSLNDEIVEEILKKIDYVLNSLKENI